MVYVPRVVDAELSELLSAVGAVVLEGPRSSAFRRPDGLSVVPIGALGP